MDFELVWWIYEKDLFSGNDIVASVMTPNPPVFHCGKISIGIKS